MSTDLEPTSCFNLTQFAGACTQADRDAGVDCRTLQVTTRKFAIGSNTSTAGFVHMDKREAFELASALLDWCEDKRDEE